MNRVRLVAYSEEGCFGRAVLLSKKQRYSFKVIPLEEPSKKKVEPELLLAESFLVAF